MAWISDSDTQTRNHEYHRRGEKIKCEVERFESVRDDVSTAGLIRLFESMKSQPTQSYNPHAMSAKSESAKQICQNKPNQREDYWLLTMILYIRSDVKIWKNFETIYRETDHFVCLLFTTCCQHVVMNRGWENNSLTIGRSIVRMRRTTNKFNMPLIKVKKKLKNDTYSFWFINRRQVNNRENRV